MRDAADAAIAGIPLEETHMLDMGTQRAEMRGQLKALIQVQSASASAKRG